MSRVIIAVGLAGIVLVEIGWVLAGALSLGVFFVLATHSLYVWLHADSCPKYHVGDMPVSVRDLRRMGFTEEEIRRVKKRKTVVRQRADGGTSVIVTSPRDMRIVREMMGGQNE